MASAGKMGELIVDQNFLTVSVPKKPVCATVSKAKINDSCEIVFIVFPSVSQSVSLYNSLTSLHYNNCIRLECYICLTSL